MITPGRKGWAEHVARMKEMGHSYNILVRKPKGSIPIGRPRLTWEDNIKIDDTK
jgi:hypothetical protein